MAKLYINATIFTGEALVEGRNLLVADSHIRDIVKSHAAITDDCEIIDCRNKILTAGLIDLQVNGGDNTLFNAAPSAEAALKIMAAHRRRGTTSLLLTCITDALPVMQQAVEAVRRARQQDRGILGIHFEGPHLSLAKRGVHSSTHIRPLSEAEKNLYQPMIDDIIMLTMAPETIPIEQIQLLRRHGAVIALGHSDADAATVRAALAAGATGFTHLFNGMGGLTARHPGVAGVALDDAASYAGLIADGHHVSPEMIRLAVKAKGADKIFLVSDAMPPAAAAQPEDFQLYGEAIRCDGKRCMTSASKLAGSAATLSDCVHYAVQGAMLPPEAALRMASATPAEFIGHDGKMGKLLPGYQADLVAMDEDLKVVSVFC